MSVYVMNSRFEIERIEMNSVAGGDVETVGWSSPHCRLCGNRLPAQVCAIRRRAHGSAEVGAVSQIWHLDRRPSASEDSLPSRSRNAG